jgi:hypothetical protein
MSLFRRISNLFSRSEVEQEIEDELRSHIEMRIEDNMAGGMPPEEARRDALLRFGNAAPLPTFSAADANSLEIVSSIELAMSSKTPFRNCKKDRGSPWKAHAPHG